MDLNDSSALLLLSQLANNQEEAPITSPTNSTNTTTTTSMVTQPTSPNMSVDSPKRQYPSISAVALVKHMQSLEERVRQLEAALHVSNHALKVPSSLTSIKFNNQPTAVIQQAQQPSSPQLTRSLSSGQTSPKQSTEMSQSRHQLTEGAIQKQPAHMLVSPTSPSSSGFSLLQVPQQLQSQQQQQSLQSPPTQPVWTTPAMVLKDASVKDVQRNILDKICLPLLEQCYDPDKGQLLVLVDELEKHFYHIDRRVLMSAVRKWFRKRREEMGTRVFMVCKCPEVISVQHGDLKEFLRSLKDNTELLDRIRSKVFLEIKDAEQARAFCVEKVDSYFRRKLAQTQSP